MAQARASHPISFVTTNRLSPKLLAKAIPDPAFNNARILLHSINCSRRKVSSSIFTATGILVQAASLDTWFQGRSWPAKTNRDAIMEWFVEQDLTDLQDLRSRNHAPAVVNAAAGAVLDGNGVQAEAQAALDTTAPGPSNAVLTQKSASKLGARMKRNLEL